MASSMQFQLKKHYLPGNSCLERFKNANLPPVQCLSGLEQEAAGLETEESLAGFNIREANHTIFKRCGVFQAGEPNHTI